VRRDPFDHTELDARLGASYAEVQADLLPSYDIWNKVSTDWARVIGREKGHLISLCEHPGDPERFAHLKGIGARSRTCGRDPESGDSGGIAPSNKNGDTKHEWAHAAA